MGLDITAYRQIKLVGKVKDVDEYEEKFDWSNTRLVYDYKDFPRHMEGLEVNGVYEYTEKYDTRIGSYSGYSWWRNAFSEVVMGVPARVVWNNLDYTDKPFYDLIYFTDCDGIIGTTMAKRLKADFDNLKEPLALPDEWSPDDREYFQTVLDRFKKAFELAADDGCIQFH